MSDTTISATELARGAGELLDAVADGASFVVERHGRPVARVSPVPTPGAALLGSAPGSARQLVSDEELLQPIPATEWADPDLPGAVADDG